MTDFRLGTREIGPGRPVCVIAELSGNHNGSLARAKELIHAASEAGADAIKLQTYTADTITMDVDNEYFTIVGGPWDGRRLYDLYSEASTPWDWHEELFAEAAERGLPCFSSPFDPSAVEFLESLGSPCYKVASFEVIDTPLLEVIAATRKPVVMSTGMASIEEIDEAVATLRDGGADELVLLTCVSAYPAPPDSIRLGNIPDLARRYGCLSGLSDHSPGHHLAVAAVAQGASLVEKHLCMSRSDGGPDAGFSLEPSEFGQLVAAIRDVERAMAQPPTYGPCGADAPNIAFRKSLFWCNDLAEGDMVTSSDIRVIRPGHGLPPSEYGAVLGRRVRRAVARGTPVLISQLYS